MSTELALYFGLFIILPGIIGVIRYKEIDKAYYPFLYLLWLGSANEILSFVLIKNGESNATTVNVFLLIESLLICYQFFSWQLFKGFEKLFIPLIFVLALFWVLETFVLRSFKVFASYFIILHSFTNVLLSVFMINVLIAKEKKKMLKNSVFLICLGLIIFFTYAVLVEAFYLYGVSSSIEFQRAVVSVMVIINLVTNFLYTLAVIWMPKKQKFSFS